MNKCYSFDFIFYFTSKKIFLKFLHDSVYEFRRKESFMFTKLSKQHTYTSLVAKNLPFNDDIKFKSIESYLSKKNTLLRTYDQDFVKFDLYSAEKIALAKASIIKKAKDMSEQSLTTGSGGNISMKIGNRILITTLGAKFSELTDQNICMVDLKGKVIDCAKGQKPSAELPLHLQAYNKRSDIGAVIHYHPAYKSVYAVDNKTILPNILSQTIKYFPNLKMEKSEDATSKASASNTINALGNDESVLMEDKSILVVGKNLDIATKTADKLKTYAEKFFQIENTDLLFKTLFQSKVNYLPSKSKNKLKSDIVDPFKTDQQLVQFISKNNTVEFNQDLIDNTKKQLVSRFLAQEDDLKVKKLSMGANGSIYKVSDESDNSLVIKMQHFDHTSENNLVKRVNSSFDSEVYILNSLPKDLKNTTNILATFKSDSGRITGFAMDFVPGKILDADNNIITKDQISQIHNNLLLLDKAKIAHRDLITTNLLVNDKGIILTDYGASKTFDEIESLSDKNIIKYKNPEFLAYSNLENFEYLGLLTYLRQLSNISDEGINLANELFDNHLKLKSDYHNKKVLILENSALTKNRDEIIKNEKILAKTFNLVAKTNDKGLIEDIKSVELLRLKMLNAQKISRMYFENDSKNYLTGIYWNYLEGVLTKQMQNKSIELQKKYENNSVLSDYFQLENKIADFHFKEIYSPMIKTNLNKINNSIDSNEIENLDTILQDGNQFGIRSINGSWIGPCLTMYKNDNVSQGIF